MTNTTFIERIYKKPYSFRRLTTLTIDEFTFLAKKLEPEWRQRERERLEARKNRRNKVGQGRHYDLGSFKNLLVVTIVYVRTNIGSEFLGFLFAVDRTTIERAIERISPLLQDRFIPKTALTKKKRRTNKLDEILVEYPELKEVIFDGTELPTNRPKKRQGQQYSGKKKRHTKKTQVAIDKKTKLIIGVSPPRKGKIHDKKQLEQTGWDKKLPAHISRYGDLGFQGMPCATWKIPHKKPKRGKLTKQQKRENKRLAKERIAVPA